MPGTIRGFLQGIAIAIPRIVDTMGTYQYYNYLEDQQALQKEEMEFNKRKYEETEKPMNEAQMKVIDQNAKNLQQVWDLNNSYEGMSRKLDNDLKVIQARIGESEIGMTGTQQQYLQEQIRQLKGKYQTELNTMIEQLNGIKLTNDNMVVKNEIDRLGLYFDLTRAYLEGAENPDLLNTYIDSKDAKEFSTKISQMEMPEPFRRSILNLNEVVLNLHNAKATALSQFDMNYMAQNPKAKEDNLRKAHELFQTQWDSNYGDLLNFIHNDMMGMGFKGFGQTSQGNVANPMQPKPQNIYEPSGATRNW